MDKFENLDKILKSYGKIAVAFSGGVDSTFLLSYGRKVLGNENVIAITANGPNFAPDEIQYAAEFCEKIGVSHEVIPVDLPPLFWSNPKDRCYHCKKEIFGQLLTAIFKITGDDCAAFPDQNRGDGCAASCNQKNSIFVPVDGTNEDDLSDYRPGQQALKELGIKSPLALSHLTKNEIREGLKAMNIEIWNKPAFACLASRIPYGEEITEEKLSSIYRLELFLRNNGFNQVRVRRHGDVARIEVLPEDRVRFAENITLMNQTNTEAKNCGFTFAALDLGGYKMGNLNTNLTPR